MAARNVVTSLSVQRLAEEVNLRLRGINQGLDNAIKRIGVDGGTISFFRSMDAGATAAFTVDFPTEYFLDQTQTAFVENFHFDAQTYPGATDPSKEGKPVLVLAVKADPKSAGTAQTLQYSFVDVSALIDTYTAGDNSINVNGRQINVKISAAANNAITLQSDGLHVDISGKANRDTTGTTGNITKLDANGNAIDSGIAADDVVVASDIVDVSASQIATWLDATE